MWAILNRHCVIALVLIGGGAAPLLAQEKKEEQKEDPVNVLPFEATEAGINTCAMIACVGAMPMPGQSQPWGVIGARVLASSENVPLTRWQFTLDRVFPINQRYLDLIRDDRPLPDVRAKELKELPVPDRAIYSAYIDALRHSHRATPEMFEKSGDDFRNVVYTHLASEAKEYRGKVITIKGKIAFIRENKAPPLLQDEGVATLYTTYIVGPTKGAPPFTAVFLELPPGVEVSERLDLTVTFQGYFLGRVRYSAEKDRGQKKDILSPWLIGKTLTVHRHEKDAEVVPAVPEDKTATSYYLISWTVGAIVAVAVLAGIMNVWFRRSDRHIQSKLQEVRDRHRPFNVEPADEGTVPPKADHERLME